jgi:16S rRNA (guanine966-N2)-methyltransferase
MRIIGGIYGSRKIKAKISDNIRPTSDRVRESMFNILANLIDFESTNVLDLFAGTGALGFESLSRGAEKVTFVEKNRKSIEIIRNVANDLKVAKENYSIVNDDVLKFLPKIQSQEKFNLILADPPYESGTYDSLIEILSSNNFIYDDGLIVIEYRTGMVIEINDKFNILNLREMGDTSFIILENLIS